MGIKVCTNQGAGTYWGPKRGKKVYNLVNFRKCSVQILLIFDIQHPWDMVCNVLCIKKLNLPKNRPIRGASFYIGLKREIHLKCSFSKTIELIWTKFGGKHHWGMEIKVCATQEAGPLWGPERGYNRGNFGCLKNIPTNQWPECVDIWYEATLGQGDSNLCNKVPGVINGPTPRKGPKRGNFLKIFWWLVDQMQRYLA